MRVLAVRAGDLPRSAAVCATALAVLAGCRAPSARPPIDDRARGGQTERAASAEPSRAASLFTDEEDVFLAFNDGEAGNPDLAEKKRVELFSRLLVAVEAGVQGKRTLWRVTAVGTADYGCACPPLLLAEFPYGAPGGDGAKKNGRTPFLFTVVTAGPDPMQYDLPSSAGRMELTGRFEGGWVLGLDWAKTDPRYSKPRTRDELEGFGVHGARFVVESWCFRYDAEAPDWARATIEKLKSDGVAACP